jgi:hypothetical protein
MTTYRKGMNPEAMHRIAGRIRGARRDVDAVQQIVGRTMGELGSHWKGGDLEGLIQQYRSSCAPVLAHLGDKLSDMAATIDRNVTAQRHTSSEPGPFGSAGATTFGDRHPKSVKHTQPDGTEHAHQQYGPWSRDDHTRTTGTPGGPGGETTTTRTTIGRDGRPYLYESDETSTRTGYVGDDGERTTTTTRRDSTLFGRLHQTEWGFKGTYAKDWSEDPYDGGPKSPTWGKDVSVKIASGEIDGLNSENYARTYGGDHANLKLWGTETRGDYDVSFKDGNLVAGATAAVGAYAVKGHLDGSTKLGMLGLSGKADGSIGADASATGKVSVGRDGVNAGVDAQAFAGAKGSLEGRADVGPVHAQAAVNAMAGAEANANANVGIGREGVKASAGVDAFAGAKAGVDGEFGVSGVTGGVGVEGYAGIGGHAKVDAQVNLNHIKAEVDVGASLGIGGGVKFNVDIEPKQIINDISKLPLPGPSSVITGIGSLFGG